jgi:hypothetical protein
MVTYVINQTDNDKAPTLVDPKTVDQSSFPIAIFGREKLEYGELMNENILHLLENFACPEDDSNPGNPDLTKALDYTLSNPVEGQLWYNSTDELLYIRDNGLWVAIALDGEVSANFGSVSHGEQLPLPVSSTGYTFSYEECAWLVAPRNYPDRISLMVCTTDPNDSTVTHQYRYIGSSTLIDGVVNYMIVAIRNNNNLGDLSAS